MIKAKPDCCEEAAPVGFGGYIPCNKPATHLVSWPDRGEGPYRMCEMCEWHSVKNRGATSVPYKRENQ